MSDIPINFIRAEVFKENGEKKYDRDLWIGIAGKARNKFTIIDVLKQYLFQIYRSILYLL